MKTFLEYLEISLLSIILGVGIGYLLKDFPDRFTAGKIVASVQWMVLILLFN